MIRNVIVYIIAFLLFLTVLLLFNSVYENLTNYSRLVSRHNDVYNIYHSLSGKLNGASILTPGPERSNDRAGTNKLFESDSASIIHEADLLNSTIRDSVNIRIGQLLNPLIRSEIGWLLRSNVADSIIHQRAPAHLAALQRMDSLIRAGIARQHFLINYREQQLSAEIRNVKTWMFLFIIVSGLLLLYTTVNLWRQQKKRKGKEQELEAVFHRINDGVISVDNNWRYTFLNDAALAVHPLGREKTIGRTLWDVHPELNQSSFGQKYREAMRTRRAVEIEDHYTPMNTRFSVKVYPSTDGLTIFYRDVTENRRTEQQLLQTVKEVSDYKFALDESSIVAITDQKGIITHANQNFCKISKYSADELIGQDHRIINSGYHSKDFIRNLWVTIANGKIWKGELKNRAKDGTIYWVDTTIVPFLNDKGKPYQYVAIRADITERKLAEERLQKTLKEIADYKYALDESSIVAITDQKGIIKHVNDNFCKISKYSANELIGQDHRIINSGYHPKAFIRDLWVTIANGKIWKGDLRNKAKDGTIYWVETTIVPFLDDKGKPYQYVAIRADITERKQAEERLIKSEKIYKTIASSIPGSVICLFDTEYRYLLIEGDMIEKLGYSREQLLGHKAEEVLAPEEFADAKPVFERVLRGEIITQELARLNYDIMSRWIPLKDEKNRVYGIMTVAIDVTKLKQAQRDVIELNRNLEEKVINRTEELRKINEELEAFSYSVSHDLRAPLRAIVGFTTILEEDYTSKLDDEAMRITSIIKESTLKMGHLIDDLLSFSRLGRQNIVRATVDTEKVVREVIDTWIAQTSSHNIQWVIHPLLQVKADPNTLRQVWINLISNAIKYSGNSRHPRIEIGSLKEGNCNVFFVKDNGIGFDQKYASKLFKVFQRLHSAEEFEGTGVGLAIVEKIISRHGGKVWAEGEPGKGATFYFTVADE